MCERIYINDDWTYKNENLKEEICVRLPHANIETTFNYFDDKIYQFESVYQKKIYAQNNWKGSLLFITFEGVAHIAEVYVNDKFVGNHKGGYTAFTFEISSFLSFGEENTIKVLVDSKENPSIPPFGNVVDYLTYGGIYREAYLEIKSNTYIKDIYLVTNDKNMQINLQTSGEISEKTIDFQIKKTTQENWQPLCKCNISSNKQEIETSFQEAESWSTENPICYNIKGIIKDGEKVIDEKIITFGFKTQEFKNDGFYLNGKKIKIVGLNRHQSYPYVGYAMPARPQQLDADILKYELGLNAVRTSHYPQSHHFINRCDEIGLLVFTEIPGWQHIGDENWKNTAIDMAEEMVLQYRNHPSIILWGARINESQDDDEFYKRTNDMIRSLDNTRQTGGVRFIKNSSLLEDVYTYNDFSHTGSNAGLEPKSKVTSNKNAPYLVSEYNGHMFPTKPFDSEIHRLEHAKRHANVLESLYSHDDITGGFGWCMFDYNTHKDFGSGDRICYHGVMNMFRVPKLASAVYKSQQDESPVLEISSSMNIGEHPGGNIEEVYAFTNADCVKLYKNDEFVKTFYPNKRKYPNMPHPPILIDDFIGELIEKHEKYSHKNAEAIKEVLRAIVKYGQNNLPIKYKIKMAKVMLLEKLSIEDGVLLYYKYVGNWGGEATTYRFEAEKDGQVIKTINKTDTKKIILQVCPDTNILKEENTYDVATVRIKITNENGEVLPYYQGVIDFETEGEIELIGANHVTAIGGGVATYVKTTGKMGSGKLIIKCENAEKVCVCYEILK